MASGKKDTPFATTSLDMIKKTKNVEQPKADVVTGGDLRSGKKSK